jgi:hypothetical protein
LEESGLPKRSEATLRVELAKGYCRAEDARLRKRLAALEASAAFERRPAAR